MRARCSFALIAALHLPAALAAQAPTTLPGTEEFAITNQRNALRYRIDVSLPASYADATSRRYPVLYLLDGNLEFALAVQVQRMVSIDRTIPEFIIVGIGYEEDSPAVYTPMYATSRQRDYTPTSSAAYPGGGKGPEFLAFLRDQLIPAIDGRYRTDPADRGLGGHSLGGLFTTYALLHEPALFKRYWLGSPSLWYDDGVAFSWLRTASEPAAGTRVFLSVGALESSTMVDPMRRMARELARRFPTIAVSSVVYPDERHGAVYSGSVSRAMNVLYAPATIPISTADARGLLGRWVNASGEALTITRAHGALAIRDRYPGLTFVTTLHAYSRDELFDNSLHTTYGVQRDATGKIVGLVKRAGMPDSVYRRTR